VKVRLLSAIAGSGREAASLAGDEWECEQDEADRLIARGMAEHIIETTAEAPPENAMRPKARPRQRQRSDTDPIQGNSEPQESE
jgi:hypothetical protein